MGIRVSKATKWVGGNYKGLVGSKLGRKGYVPVRVGKDEESCRMFMVEMKALRDERFCELLFKSADELGFHNEGVLRILHEPHDFEHYILISQYTPKRIRNLGSIPKCRHFFHRFRALNFH